MATVRTLENPIVRPQNLRPSRDDFEISGVFNAAVTQYPLSRPLLILASAYLLLVTPAIRTARDSLAH